jgi:hypothetical protein
MARSSPSSSDCARATPCASSTRWPSTRTCRRVRGRAPQ